VGLKLKGKHQFLAYAEDVNILGDYIYIYGARAPSSFSSYLLNVLLQLANKNGIQNQKMCTVRLH
jgi:hypothetical protein